MTEVQPFIIDVGSAVDPEAAPRFSVYYVAATPEEALEKWVRVQISTLKKPSTITTLGTGLYVFDGETWTPHRTVDVLRRNRHVDSNEYYQNLINFVEELTEFEEEDAREVFLG